MYVMHNHLSTEPYLNYLMNKGVMLYLVDCFCQLGEVSMQVFHACIGTFIVISLI